MIDPLLLFALKDKLSRMDATVAALRHGSSVRLPDYPMAKEIEAEAVELAKNIKLYEGGGPV